MHLSLKLVAAAAFFLPSLVSARGASYHDSVSARLDRRETYAEPELDYEYESLSRREAYAEAEASPYDHYEEYRSLTRREASLGAQIQRMLNAVKREAFEDAIVHLQRRTTKADLDKKTSEYKAAQSTLRTETRNFKAERDWAKKGVIANKAIASVTLEVKLREEAETMATTLKTPKEELRKHAVEIANKKKCLANWQKKKQWVNDEAAKKAGAKAAAEPTGDDASCA